MKDKYSKIINLPNHRSKRYPHMSVKNRCAQFSAFEALDEYGDEILEASRLTNPKKILNNDDNALLNKKVMYIMNNIKNCPDVSVRYFAEDERKTGGKYLCHFGKIRRIDLYEKEIIFFDGKRIPLGDVSDINSEELEKAMEEGEKK